VGSSGPNTRSVRPGSSDAGGSQPHLHANHPRPYHPHHNSQEPLLVTNRDLRAGRPSSPARSRHRQGDRRALRARRRTGRDRIALSGRIRLRRGSVWYGAIGNARTVGYNITKEAVRGLTRTAAREWAGHAITVNVVEPAAKTDAADNIERANPEAMAAAVAAIPMGRLGDPHLDIAPAVLYLATDDARFITGRTLGVDGGMFLHA
jgi:NAD(P)-dependent dehydrogenase (short-subunit alcohol dehydrogenase family)